MSPFLLRGDINILQSLRGENTVFIDLELSEKENN